jgi:hypothetical protein
MHHNKKMMLDFLHAVQRAKHHPYSTSSTGGAEPLNQNSGKSVVKVREEERAQERNSRSRL